MNQGTLHILVVEDNPADIGLLRAVLAEAKFPYQLHVALDGQEALDFLQVTTNPRPHLILLDLNLPRMSGHQVLAILKQHERWRQIPVFIFSTSADEADVQLAYDLHANCFIQKPNDLHEFFTIMRLIETCWVRVAEFPVA